jgi:MerR family transcriptional regulator, heat shock protein HspR
MTFQLVVQTADDEALYPRLRAAELAQMSLEMLIQCEEEQLVAARAMAGGQPGYTAADIRRLARVRRLCDELGLDLATVEVVLHLRHQVLLLLAELEEREAQMARREQELLGEIRQWRSRYAQEPDWGY